MVLGADTGVEDHLFGLAEHLELQAMVDAGMTPAQVLVAATSRAAEYLHLDDRGSLVPGKRADLLVLDASPLDDIVNTRRISRTVHQRRRDRSSRAARADQRIIGGEYLHGYSPPGSAWSWTLGIRMFRELVLVALAVSVLAPTAAAHHSRAEYDMTQEIVVEGTVAALAWKNPHIFMTVETKVRKASRLAWRSS